jgi:hypothetical protein
MREVSNLSVSQSRFHTDTIHYEQVGMVWQALANPIDITSCDCWICWSAFEMFLAYHTDSPTPHFPSKFMIQNPTDREEENDFSMWEPGWSLRVQKKIKDNQL